MVVILAWASYSDQAQYAGWGGDDRTRYQSRAFTCTNIVDGDTIDIDIPDGRYEQSRLRLWGVDTPEVSGKGRREMHFGPQASQFTTKKLLNKEVYIELAADRTRDIFGRVLAYVYLQESGELFNALIIEQGYAYADTRFDHPKMGLFVQLEEEARQESRGLWKNLQAEQMPGWRRKKLNKSIDDK